MDETRIAAPAGSHIGAGPKIARALLGISALIGLVLLAWGASSVFAWFARGSFAFPARIR